MPARSEQDTETAIGMPETPTGIQAALGSSPPWYAVYVRSQCERSSEKWFDRGGIEHFSPFISRPIKVRKSNLERTETPLLPGYVFIRAFISQPFEIPGPFGMRHMHILEVPGVVHVVGYGDKPEPIPEIDIQSLRILTESGMSVHAIALAAEGDYVKVTRGPLAGAEGYVAFVSRKKDRVRFSVSIEMMGRSCCTEFEAHELQKCQPVILPPPHTRSITSPGPKK